EWPSGRMSALPPGGNPGSPERSLLSGTGSSGPGAAAITLTSIGRSEPEQLRLLYVGGVKPPLYDLKPLFEAVTRATGTILTVCCRQEGWAAVSGGYRLPENLRVVHRSGEELAEIYSETDAIAIMWREHPYMEFAM